MELRFAYHEQRAQDIRPQPAQQLQNWQRTVQMSLTLMTLSDRSHAPEERENLQSLAPDSVVSMILRIETRLAIRRCDDSKNMFCFGVFFPLGKSAQSPLPLPHCPQTSSFLACLVPNCVSFLMLQRKTKTKLIWPITPWDVIPFLDTMQWLLAALKLSTVLLS